MKKRVVSILILFFLLNALMLYARKSIVTPSPVRPLSSFAGYSTSYPIPFVDDFEKGNIYNWDFTNGGFWHFLTNPQKIKVADDILQEMVELPDDGYLPYAYSGSTVLWYGEDSTGTFIGSDYKDSYASYDYDPWSDDTDYSDDSWYDSDYSFKNGGTSKEANSGYVVSPQIDLSGAKNPELSFYSWWEIEGVDVNTYDLMHVEISTDGQYFTELGKLNPINDVDGESYKPYSSAGLGEPGIWKKYTFDLSEYAGKSVYIRFRFETIDTLYNGFRGWLVDDFAVKDKSSSGDVNAAPTITKVSPTAAYPGQIVEVYGKNFYYTSKIILSKGPLFTETVDTVYQGNTHLAFYLPSDSAAGSSITIYVQNPDGSKSNSMEIKVVEKTDYISIDSVSPSSTYDNQALTLKITGTNLENTANVSLGGISASQIEVDPYGKYVKAIFGACTLSSGYKNVEVQDVNGSVTTKYGAVEVIESGKCNTGGTDASSILDFRNTCVGTEDPVTIRIEKIIYNADLLGPIYVWAEFKFNLSTVSFDFVSAGVMPGDEKPSSTPTTILDFSSTCVGTSSPMNIKIQDIVYNAALLGSLNVWATFQFDINTLSLKLLDAGGMEE